MNGDFILITSYLILPAILLYLCHRFPAVDKLSAIALAYILGIILGNTGLLPANKNEILESISAIAIPIAFPLLLFSLNLRGALTRVGKSFISMLTAVLSVVVMVSLGYYLFGSRIEDGAPIAGMLIGVYTGGTPNLASLSAALGVNPDTYLITHTYDMMLGAVYLSILLTAVPRLLRRILPHYRSANESEQNKQTTSTANMSDYSGMLRSTILKPLLVAFTLSATVFLISVGISLYVPENSRMATITMLITSFGLILSLVPRIHSIEKTFQLGMYFIVVFCLAVASMADLRSILQIEYLYLIYYITLVYFGSLAIHVAISAVLKIDADTTIITSTALLFSPPFVPVVAGVLKNRQILISGIAVGILGYAIGNYLGIALFLLLG